MTRDAIITELYTCSEVDYFLSKIIPRDHQDDFKQHVFMILAEKEDDFIVDLYTRGKIKQYVVGTIIKLKGFKQDKFWRERRIGTEIPFDFSVLDDNQNEEHIGGEIHRAVFDLELNSLTESSATDQELTAIQACSEELNAVYWYNKYLFELYMEHGTYQKVSDYIASNPNTKGQTINPRSVCNAVNAAKRQIKEGVQCIL